MTPPSFRAKNSTNATATTAASGIAVTKPAGTAEGDLLVIFVYGDQGGSWSAPDGTWTGRTSDITAGNGRIAVFTKLAGASEPASYTVKPATSNSYTTIAIAAYSGVDQTTPVAAFQKTVDGSAATTVTFPAATATGADSLVVRMVAAKTNTNNTPAVTPPASYTERYEQLSPAVQFSFVEASDLSQAAAGAVPSVTGSVSQTSLNWGQYTMVLNPSSSAVLAGDLVGMVAV